MKTKKFNELDRLRCDHCGKWREELVTSPDSIENYGYFGVCVKCIKEHDINYWKEWSVKRLKQK